MDPLVILLIVLVLGNAATIYLLWKRTQTTDEGGGADTQGFMLLQSQLSELSRAMENKLGEGTNRMFEGMKTQSEQSERLISTISRQVTEQLVEVTKGVTATQESTKQSSLSPSSSRTSRRCSSIRSSAAIWARRRSS